MCRNAHIAAPTIFAGCGRSWQTRSDLLCQLCTSRNRALVSPFTYQQLSFYGDPAPATCLTLSTPFAQAIRLRDRRRRQAGRERPAPRLQSESLEIVAVVSRRRQACRFRVPNVRRCHRMRHETMPPSPCFASSERHNDHSNSTFQMHPTYLCQQRTPTSRNDYP